MESGTPGYVPNKASDLIQHMNNNVSLPRIQSSRSSQLQHVQSSIIGRQQSRAKMLEIQRGPTGAVSNKNVRNH